MMTLEEIKKEIVNVVGMSSNDLLIKYRHSTQMANWLFKLFGDDKREEKPNTSWLITMMDEQIKSLIYENEILDRLNKGEKTKEYLIEQEYANEDLRVEIKELKLKIEELQKPIEKGKE